METEGHWTPQDQKTYYGEQKPVPPDELLAFADDAVVFVLFL